jgi:hypothetical protein
MNDHASELLKTVAAILSFLAAVLSLVKVFLPSRPPSSRDAELKSGHPPAPVLNTSQRLRRNLLSGTSIDFEHEAVPIVATGVLINYFSLIIAVSLPSILYLDMTGTAFVSLLLGPWWGATTAVLSSTLFNPLFYPHPSEGFEILVPWVLVNICGALFWGFAAQAESFRRLTFERVPISPAQYFRYFLIFGVVAACVMAIPGAAVGNAAGHRLALNADVQKVLERTLKALKEAADSYFGGRGTTLAACARFWVEWFVTSIRYIPDKTVSCAAALMCVRYGFPLFERELIREGSRMDRLKCDSLAHFILMVLYLPAFWQLAWRNAGTAIYWPLWSTPIVAVLVWECWRRIAARTIASEKIMQERAARRQRYSNAATSLRCLPIGDFYARVSLKAAWFALTSLIFLLILALPILEPGELTFREFFYEVVFNFAAKVYGVLAIAVLARVAIAQSIAIVLDKATPEYSDAPKAVSILRDDDPID